MSRLQRIKITIKASEIAQFTYYIYYIFISGIKPIQLNPNNKYAMTSNIRNASMCVAIILTFSPAALILLLLTPFFLNIDNSLILEIIALIVIVTTDVVAYIFNSILDFNEEKYKELDKKYKNEKHKTLKSIAIYFYAIINIIIFILATAIFSHNLSYLWSILIPSN